MATRRFNFADQEPDPPPKGFWIKRLLVTSLIAGSAAFYHIHYDMGFSIF